jgi:hypothetical protein
MEGDIQTFDLLDVRASGVHKYLKEVLRHAGGAL